MSSESGTLPDPGSTLSRSRDAPADGRVAVVSGGDQGIGPLVVRRLAAHGLRVVLGCRSAERGRLVIDDLGPLADRVAVRRLDVTDPDSEAALAEWVAHRLGRCDVLVSCLAPAAPDRLWPDLRGTRRFARRVAPMMRACGYGRIVTVVAGDVPPGGPDPLTTVLPGEPGDHGILTNAYCRPPANAAEARAAADTAVWLATLPDDGPTGRLYG